MWRTALGAAAFALLTVTPAAAIEIELLDDVATDRIERQRAYARGAVPLPGTPDTTQLDARLAAKGLARGSPIFIRIFKASSELELWMQKGERFELLGVYPVCHWTGSLGPKLKEGDKQSPEGFYSVADRQMRLFGRWPQAFNLGFPNAYDRANRRTGSHILVHGGCSSTGCFAMTETVQHEIRALAEAALRNGQARFHVHVFPFRMTEAAMAEHAGHAWIEFWRDLKPGYDAFERTRVPPRIAVCGQRYKVGDGEPGFSGSAEPLSVGRPGLAVAGGPACDPPAAVAVGPATQVPASAAPAVAVPASARASVTDQPASLPTPPGQRLLVRHAAPPPAAPQPSSARRMPVPRRNVPQAAVASPVVELPAPPRSVARNRAIPPRPALTAPRPRVAASRRTRAAQAQGLPGNAASGFSGVDGRPH